MKPVRTALIISLMVFSLNAQTGRQSLNANASLEQTLDWLKKNLAFNWIDPQRTDAVDTEPDRHMISHFRSKGCVLEYDAITEFGGRGARAINNEERQHWKVDLAGLNPDRIKLVVPGIANQLPRIIFGASDPLDSQASQPARNGGVAMIYTDGTTRAQIKSNGPVIVENVQGKAIWHHDERRGSADSAGYAAMGTLMVKDEAKGRQLTAAFQHAVELCRQEKPGKSTP